MPSMLRSSLRDLLSAPVDGERHARTEEPFRAELFSLDQLERHAGELASRHRVDPRGGRNLLLSRLADNQQVLERTHRLVRAAAERKQGVPPAGEWLLDNFFLVEEQIRTVRRHLPRGYSRELPRLTEGEHAALPRVYALGLELISHLDGRIDEETLTRFIAAYQRSVSLAIGELWALPIMLRLGLIENLRRIAVRIGAAQRHATAAAGWAERMISIAEHSSTDLVVAIADLARSEQAELGPAFVAEFARRLHGQNPALAIVIGWLDQRLVERGTTLQELGQGEAQAAAADQVAIGNTIGSLRSLNAIDWKDFVEAQSAIERTLRDEASRIYVASDFGTRDQCRHAVEELARRSRLPEQEVARRAVALADSPDGGDALGRGRHVAWHLIGPGYRALERSLRARRSPAHLLAALGRAWPLGWYAGGIACAAAGATAAACLPDGLPGLPPAAAVATAAAVALVASQWAVGLVNWLVTLLVAPRPLPRMDFSGGIPAACAALVVVPTMFRSRDELDQLVDALEVRYLANRDPQLYFALLTDFADAAQEQLPGDQELLAHACARIDALNRRYHHDHPNRFFLFHRPRRWNPRERRWMGWERKRGKLDELNALLLHGERAPFSAVVGEPSALRGIAYVVTLDTDTQLPRDAARLLVATMAHPLNRPRLDERTGLVREGYAVLQPRAAITMTSAVRSRFAAWFCGDPGIDPYTRAVSDVYQDAFGEGSFVGKGIYDLVAFTRSLAGRFPDNAILSHDLIEGCYARSGLVTDVYVMEEFPSRYLAESLRRKRWIRGDWQLLPWLLPWAPSAARGWRRNVLPALARWKIADNLRRSLVAPALLALLVAGWTVLPGPWWRWDALAALLLFSQPLLAAALRLPAKPRELRLAAHLGHEFADALGELGRIAFQLAVLPYEAGQALDATLRTLWRLLVTRRHLLEWQTASDAERNARADLPGVALALWSCPAAAVAATWWTAQLQPDCLAAALPVTALWAVAPLLAWWVSRPLRLRVQRLESAALEELTGLARRTWAFFERFVGQDDHWLPPDNYQEIPTGMVAHRTSPTNIGLSLLANLAAWDFGFIPLARLLDRTERCLATMQALERFRGHFLNWYDTRTLRALTPRYVSMVDSGNLAGHLITLRQGLGELPDLPLLAPRLFSGLRATLGEARRTLRAAPTLTIADDGLEDRLVECTALLARPAPGIAAALARLDELIGALAALPPAGQAEVRGWIAALADECRAHRDQLAALAPWRAALAMPEAAWSHADPALAEALAELRALLAECDATATVARVAALPERLAPLLATLAGAMEPVAAIPPPGAQDTPGDVTAAERAARLRQLAEASRAAAEAATQACAQLEAMARRADEFADMDFTFLYDRSQDLFAIGYNVGEGRLDRSYYDLLASEARLGSFIAIATGQVHQEHWFSLGRPLVAAGTSGSALLSWSGTMFEYLMPMLVMPSYQRTLLHETCVAVVDRQIRYGRQRQVPWGISESAYNLTDGQLAYQYRAFGVPGLGLKRGLADDLVVAPYATEMALMVEPQAAWENLRRLAAEGCEGPYGPYEAIDFTPARLPQGKTREVIRSYMAHHQGMGFLALAYLLLERPMQRRFLADPQCRATELLLHERVPRAPAEVRSEAAENAADTRGDAEHEPNLRVIANPDTAVAEVALLSNGRYHVMVSAAGGGASRWQGLAVNRWREDPTRDCWGMFCYVRDIDRNACWSTTHQPTLKPSRDYEAIFTQGRAEFRRRDLDIDAHTEIAVSPEDDIELRRTTLTNRSGAARVIEITSYAEVVIAPAAADEAHPAFSNLFVQTRAVPAHHALFCTRRARKPGEAPPCLFHLMALQGVEVGEASYETDRGRFLGRGRSAARPAALHGTGPLSGSIGPVLDPIVAVRRTVVLQPDESAIVDLVYGIAATAEQAEALAAKYHDHRLTDRVFGLAMTHSQLVLGQLGASVADAQVYARLAGTVVYANAQRRAPASVLLQNRRGQSGLWGYGISGDQPLVLLRITDAERLDLVRQVLRAHAYWRSKGLVTDLVIWNEDHSVYRQSLHDQIIGLVAAGSTAGLLDRPGGVFVRRLEQIAEEDRILIQTVARVVIGDSGNSLAHFVERRGRIEVLPPRLQLARFSRPDPGEMLAPAFDLVYHNGIGGFTRDGREYIVVLRPGATTPAPWVNVLANPRFGTVVTESGTAYTWSENCHEFRLTPWYNDPVSDPSGEAHYLRDEETGRSWSPTPGAARGAGTYVVRHGFGYTIYESLEQGIACSMSVFVAVDAPVKFAVLRVRNRSGRARRLSVFGFAEWTLGELRQRSAMQVVTELERGTGALLARNPYSADFASRVAFSAVSGTARSYTCDRSEFLGRNGGIAEPAALGRTHLGARSGAGYDPCAALQVSCDLADGEERELAFVLGAGGDRDEAVALVQRFRGVEPARRALEAVWERWKRTLGAVQVATPDPALDLLANGWLLYQTLACRMWARSGFYQSGGAFGFRDQLQDAMALLHCEPGLLREQILRAAAHQFREGDVQHWWHPPADRGVRTLFSDDYLWLPHAVCRYVHGTGDTGVLDELVPFLTGRPVPPEEEAYYDAPGRSEESGTLYEHCVRALVHALRVGEHGLPLMGCGDWNDGMNLVGIHGKGESVWLGFFLNDVLRRFAELARARGEQAFAERCESHAELLRHHLEVDGWDGRWYRRAYFDDGQPLGSAVNPECQIDSLPQSWAVLSGATKPELARGALEEAERRLVVPEHRLVRLFDPPFDKSALEPGYIKGYLPGVRENGGQYTHAAIWMAMAFAQLGESGRAWQLHSYLNPVLRTDTPQGIATYRVEPYVMAADIYSVPPHGGRGGWTWYTGSAGWMYRFILESLLGVTLEGARLRFRPCLPEQWRSGYTVRYRYRETPYELVFTGRGAPKRLIVDGTPLSAVTLTLEDDRRPHRVEIELG